MNSLFSAAVAASLFLSTGYLLAEDPVADTVTAQTITGSEVAPILSSSGMVSAISGILGPWVKVGFLLGISVFVVMVGWRWCKKFIGR